MQDQKEQEPGTPEREIDRELFDAIVRHIGEFFETDVSYLTPDSQLSSSIEGMSSLRLVELLLYLEDCLGLDFDDAVVDRLESMRDLVDYVRRLRSSVK